MGFITLNRQIHPFISIINIYSFFFLTCRTMKVYESQLRFCFRAFKKGSKHIFEDPVHQLYINSTYVCNIQKPLPTLRISNCFSLCADIIWKMHQLQILWRPSVVISPIGLIIEGPRIYLDQRTTIPP